MKTYNLDDLKIKTGWDETFCKVIMAMLERCNLSIVETEDVFCLEDDGK